VSSAEQQSAHEAVSERQGALARVQQALANHNSTRWPDSNEWFARKRQLLAQCYQATEALRVAKLALVRVSTKKATQVDLERERCARIAEDALLLWRAGSTWVTFQWIEDRIRAGSEPMPFCWVPREWERLRGQDHRGVA
jgi:hypothetical protein